MCSSRGAALISDGSQHQKNLSKDPAFVFYMCSHETGNFCFVTTPFVVSGNGIFSYSRALWAQFGVRIHIFLWRNSVLYLCSSVSGRYFRVNGWDSPKFCASRKIRRVPPIYPKNQPETEEIEKYRILQKIMNPHPKMGPQVGK